MAHLSGSTITEKKPVVGGIAFIKEASPRLKVGGDTGQTYPREWRLEAIGKDCLQRNRVS